MDLISTLANELKIKPNQVSATIKLLDEGATVPFIARYRKEVTGALDDQKLRELHTRLSYLRELLARKKVILDALTDQQQLTEKLRTQVNNADTKSGLEEIYAPYKSKRVTKAVKARNAGLDKLLNSIISTPSESPLQLANAYIDENSDYTDNGRCLEGAQAILAEQINQSIELVSKLKAELNRFGEINTKLVKGHEESGAKFKDYFAYSAPLKKQPSHRILAIQRGSSEGHIKVSFVLDNDHFCLDLITRSLQLPSKGQGGKWLQDSIQQIWSGKLKNKLFKELFNAQLEASGDESIKVFCKNLEALLLAPPAGAVVTLGLDPGLRTGVKVAVVDETGKLLEHSTIFPHAPRNQWDESISRLAKLCLKHKVKLISIGNGTASRETDKLTSELRKKHPELGLQQLIVSEAGASVYSASELAASELPDIDVTIRGAVSIARRVQDPLAELVKIEPKAIGVGQYQHDVDQKRLGEGLEAVIEDCVNSVGVDLNSASQAILCRISGLNDTLATNIIKYRDQVGKISSRNELKKVKRLGPKAFEQAAAFLRIRDGKQLLDSSSVHPEAYSLVEHIAKQNSRSVASLIGDSVFLNSLQPADYISDQFGLYTVKDIICELDKPGRDPRPEFKTAKLQDGVETITDLQVGMRLEGTISNVTNFGAFVDLGVHQDGLVHISQLANKFVKDPHDVVAPGQIVTVGVLEVDEKRKRISLTMRTAD